MCKFILTFKGMNIMSFEGDPVNALWTKFTAQSHKAEPHKHSETLFNFFYILTEFYVQISKLNLSYLQGNIKKIAGFFYW